MNTKLKISGVTYLSATLFLSVGAFANSAVDNTKHNAQDRHTSSLTADQQKNDKADMNLTQRIRKDLMEDDKLSTYAHNIKIITANGVVTLKGPVRSESEKLAIAQKAEAEAGAGKVHNRLEVAHK